MKGTSKKGFTLIELLVVIAIIGILSSVVLVSLSGAKDRANDGRIISDMDQIRTQAEIVDGNKGNYAMVMAADADNDAAAPYASADTDIKKLCDDVDDVKGSTSNVTFQWNQLKAETDGDKYTEYCAYVQLNSGDYWCVDSQLTSKNVGSTAPTATCGATAVLFRCVAP